MSSSSAERAVKSFRSYAHLSFVLLFMRLGSWLEVDDSADDPVLGDKARSRLCSLSTVSSGGCRDFGLG